MRLSTTAICLVAGGMLIVQGPIFGKGGGIAHAGGGGGFNGGSIGNAGHVNNLPYYGGYSGYGYAMGPVGIEGDGSLGGSSGSSAPTAYTGTGGGPPGELQDGTGVYVSDGEIASDGASWDNDWWDHDPRSAEEQAAAMAPDAGTGTAVASLPRGYSTIFYSDTSYYYSKGVFYEAADSGYQVVAPPMGIEVNQVPNEAEMVNINSQQFFVYNDTYYQALYGGSGIVYKVVEDPHS